MMCNFTKSAAVQSNFGNNVRDSVLQAQIDGDVGHSIVARIVDDDETKISVQLLNKAGQTIGEPACFIADPSGNKVVNSLTIQDVEVEGEIDKQLVIGFKGGSATVNCSLRPIYDAIAAETTRATTAETTLNTKITAETSRATTAEATITTGYQTADAEIRTDLTALTGRVTVAESDIVALKAEKATVMKVNFTLAESGALTADKTPDEVYSALATKLVLGFITDKQGSAQPLGPCISGLRVDNGFCVTRPVFAAGSGQFEIIPSTDYQSQQFN